MSQDDYIEYSGPPLDYVPEIGGRVGGENRATAPADFINTTYANREYILNRLNALDILIANTESLIENIMTNHSMPIRRNDAPLQEAHRAEWPLDEDPSEQVTYQYYKYLSLRNTVSSQYIRKKYEEAVRDVTGTNAIDVAKIFELIKNESALVRQFLNTYLGDMDDTAEFRTAELLQDWVVSATGQVQKLQEVLAQDGSNTTLPEEEIESISPEEARKAQAVFKVKLNSINDELARHFEITKRNWAEHADVFFDQYLGPSLSFRLNVSRSAYPVNSVIGKEVYLAAGSMNYSLSSLLADYARRNTNFNAKVNEMVSLITTRDVYRGYIHQLASKGVAIDSDSIRATTNQADSPAIINGLQSAISSVSDTIENRFTSSHDSLDERENPGAHPQYLLRSGGRIEGNISVKDGIKIDNVDLNLHKHTGSDGSARINASSIEYGSLTPDLVNTEKKPSQPFNLTLQSLTPRTLPSGQVLVDAVIVWESEDGDMVDYEVSIGKIG